MILHVKNLEISSIFKVDLYENKYGINVSYHRDSIFCCGGYDGKAHLDTCAIVNLESQKVDYSTKLNEKKSHSALVSSSYYLFCLGGFNEKYLNSCEYLDTSQKLCWKMGNQLNQTDNSITSIYVEPNYIYTFGGEDHNSL